MIGGKVIGIVRRPGLPTILNVGGDDGLPDYPGQEPPIPEPIAVLLGETDVRCDEPGCVRIGDEVWWNAERVFWTPRIGNKADPDVAEWLGDLGDVAFPRRA